jgi:hypothetical protein
MAVENLWEGLVLNPPKPIFLEILSQQITYLSEMTEGKLVGSLERFEVADNKIRYDMDIVVPALDDYSFTLLSVLKGPGAYPLDVEYGLENRELQQCQSEAEFKKAIKAVFSSEKTQDAISSTLSLIDAESNYLPHDEQ